MINYNKSTIGQSPLSLYAREKDKAGSMVNWKVSRVKEVYNANNLWHVYKMVKFSNLFFLLWDCIDVWKEKRSLEVAGDGTVLLQRLKTVRQRKRRKNALN